MSGSTRLGLALLLITSACESAESDSATARQSAAQSEEIVARTVEQALAATEASRLHAVELDLIDDDVVVRDGVVVLLGHERGQIVGLTTRFCADIRYPDPKLIADGFGDAELGPQRLEVAGEQFSIVPSDAEMLHPDQVRRAVFDDHDLALLYFDDESSVAELETLGLPAPTRQIERALAATTQLYGIQMTLVSPESMSAMRGAIQVDGAGRRLLVLAIAAALVPAVGLTFGAEAIDPILIERIQAALTRELAQ